MKIISKYKDYYDYLSGIYGEDPLIVLDRRSSDPKQTFMSDTNYKLRLYIGGHLVEGWYIGGQYYYGNDLEQFRIPDDANSKYIRRLHFGSTTLQKLYGRIDVGVVDIKHEYIMNHTRTVHVLTEPIVDLFDINEKENCPIVLKTDDNNNARCYPKLDELGLAVFLPADLVYRWISDWVSLQRTKAENHIDTRTNVEKIESDGFDKVTSFRK
jgi:hypothetical protein